MGRLLFFLLLSAGFKAIAQEADSITMGKVNELIANLKSNGISKIAYRKSYCVGCRPFIETEVETGAKHFPCSYHFTLFLFWESKNQGFIKRFDACGESPYGLVDANRIFEIPDIYAGTMKKEKLNSFSFKENNSKDTSTYFSMIDHGGLSDLFYYNSGDSLHQSIDFYDLTEMSDGRKNLSYESNRKLKIVLWDEQLGEIASEFKKEKKLKSKN